MSEEGLTALYEIPQVVNIINKCGLSSKTEIKEMLKMACRDYISVDVVNKTPIREYGRKKIYQTFKYTILNNGAYYVHHDCDKNQKVRGKVAVPCPWYGHGGVWLKISHANLYIQAPHPPPPKRRGALRLTSM